MKELAARIVDHYERHARNWDAGRNCFVKYPSNDKPWLERFVGALPAAKATVLDLG